MTDPVPSKESNGPIRYEQVLRTDGDPDMRTNGKGEWVRFADHARIVERLRTALTGISTCSTCEACRGAALRALGEDVAKINAAVDERLDRVERELAEGPGDAGYTEMLERIRDEVGVEIFDMQHPHTWIRAVRAAQPPGDGQQ